MSDDIVARLRKALPSDIPSEEWDGFDPLFADAIAEIERLRAALERADILIHRAGLAQNGHHWEAVMQYEAARAALKENT